VTVFQFTQDEMIISLISADMNCL